MVLRVRYVIVLKLDGHKLRIGNNAVENVCGVFERAILA